MGGNVGPIFNCSQEFATETGLQWFWLRLGIGCRIGRRYWQWYRLGWWWWWLWRWFGLGRFYDFGLFPTGFVLVGIAVLIGLFAGRKEKKRQAKERNQYSHRIKPRKSRGYGKVICFCKRENENKFLVRVRNLSKVVRNVSFPLSYANSQFFPVLGVARLPTGNRFIV